MYSLLRLIHRIPVLLLMNHRGSCCRRRRCCCMLLLLLLPPSCSSQYYNSIPSVSQSKIANQISLLFFTCIGILKVILTRLVRLKDRKQLFCCNFRTVQLCKSINFSCHNYYYNDVGLCYNKTDCCCGSKMFDAIGPHKSSHG